MIEAHARSLDALGLAVDPLSDPLSYPGRIPTEPGLLVDDRFLRVIPLPGAPLGTWLVGQEGGGQGRELDDLLAELGHAPVSGRHPVVSIGSNAAPAQMYAKLTRVNVRVVLPMIQAKVAGILAGVSAHVSRPGYVPATPVADTGATSMLVVLWLDDAQLKALDLTEPNYYRVVLPDRFPVMLPSGERVAGPYCYLSRHGCIADKARTARLLKDQATLLGELLEDIPGLQAICGTTPEEWISRMTDPDARDNVRARFRTEGYVLDQQAEFTG